MELEIPDGVKENIYLIGASLLIVLVAAGLKNLTVPEEPVEVGYTEVSTECYGLNAGICLGLQRRDYTTYNYNNYTDPEPGTENYYRRIESELMLRAYNTCDRSISGMEWTSEVEYRNKTAEEWNRNENIQLLPCEKAFFRKLNATR